MTAIVLAGAAVLATTAGIASHHFGQDAQRPVPLFVMSAQQTDLRASWPPPGGPVAFNDETIALLTMAANASRTFAMAEPEPDRPMTRQERRRARQEERERLRAEQALGRDEARNARGQSREVVEVYVRDSRGNIRRVERVEREGADDRRRTSAPNPLRMFSPFGRW